MTRAELTQNLPAEWPDDLIPEIHEALAESGKTLVILDEDPSGTQAVFDVQVLTRLDEQAIEAALDEQPPVLFLLLESGALDSEKRGELLQKIADILRKFGDHVTVVSRSHPTLVGRFPLENDLLRAALGLPDAPTLFIPFCETGGHLTVGDSHYLNGADHLAPIDLREYLGERIGSSQTITSISIEELRSGEVSAELAALPDGCTCIINAASRRDLEVLALALHGSERRFLFQSAASFVQTFAGIVTRPPLEPWQMQDLDPNPNGGVIIIGSRSPKADAQLAHLLGNATEVVPLEVEVSDLLEGHRDEPGPLASRLEALVASGKTAALYFSHDQSEMASLSAISRSIGSLVEALQARPAFFIVKGDAISADLARDALGMERAMVLGQILPGVPVWTLGNETRHPGLAYIIFPTGIGSDDSLTEAYRKLIT